MRLDNIIILQNIIDPVKTDAASVQHDKIRHFVAYNMVGNAPDVVYKICPIMFQYLYEVLRWRLVLLSLGFLM